MLLYSFVITLLFNIVAFAACIGATPCVLQDVSCSLWIVARVNTKVEIFIDGNRLVTGVEAQVEREAKKNAVA